jgi:hypothetical protein
LLNPQQTKKLGARVLPQMCDLCIMLQKLMPATSILLLLIAVQACAQPKLPDTGCKAPSHDAWSTLLRKHVSAEGHVAYADLLKDSTALNAYLKVLASLPARCIMVAQRAPGLLDKRLQRLHGAVHSEALSGEKHQGHRAQTCHSFGQFRVGCQVLQYCRCKHERSIR